MLIQAKDIHYYMGDKFILKGINLSLQPQQIITILGPNGAGKSTLIKILVGLLSPTSGIVTRKQHLKIAYVPQLFTRQQWMPITVLDVLKLYTDFDINHPILTKFNLQPILGYQISQLSGGELQKVLIAQAILQQPELLVLDEPLQGIDFSGQNTFYSLMQELRQDYKLSILLVSHDIHLVMAQTDLVLCLHQHICCMGKPDNIQQDPEFLRLFGLNNTKHVGIYTHHHNHSHDW